LGSQERGRSSDRLHVHLWASPPPHANSGVPALGAAARQDGPGDGAESAGGRSASEAAALCIPQVFPAASPGLSSRTNFAVPSASPPWVGESVSGPSLSRRVSQQLGMPSGGPSPALGSFSHQRREGAPALGSSVFYEGRGSTASSFPASGPPALASGGRPPPVEPVAFRSQPEEFAYGSRERAFPGHAGSFPAGPSTPFNLNQAENDVFAELGRKQPQPKDNLVAVYPGSGPPQDACHNGNSSSSTAAPWQMPSAGNSLSSTAAPWQMPSAEARSRGQIPAPSAPSSAAPTRPMSAGPSGRNGRHGTVHQGQYGSLSRDIREHDLVPWPADYAYRTSSNWSGSEAGYRMSRTGYEGGSEASLSARGLGGSHLGGLGGSHLGVGPLGASLHGGLLLAGGEVGAAFRPFDRPDEVMWAK